MHAEDVPEPVQPKKRGRKRKVRLEPEEDESAGESSSEIPDGNAGHVPNDALVDADRDRRTASSIFKDIAAGGSVPQKRVRKPTAKRRAK
jgi:hypothetical protein